MTPIRLAPLAEADTLGLVRHLASPGTARDGVERLARRVWRLSEGHPFMVVETVRAVQEGAAPETAEELPLAQRIQELILGRLERLAARSQKLVGIAAVIGREFEYELLQRAAGISAQSAAESVHDLVRRRVLHSVGERLAFTHDRIREVAYRQMLPPRRRLLHGAVARAMEAVYAQNLELHWGVLAGHYRGAGVWAKATACLRRRPRWRWREAPSAAVQPTSRRRWLRSSVSPTGARHARADDRSAPRAVGRPAAARRAREDFPGSSATSAQPRTWRAPSATDASDGRRCWGGCSTCCRRGPQRTRRARSPGERGPDSAQTLGDLTFGLVPALRWAAHTSRRAISPGHRADPVRSAVELDPNGPRGRGLGLYLHPAVGVATWLATVLAPSAASSAGASRHGREAVASPRRTTTAVQPSWAYWALATSAWPAAESARPRAPGTAGARALPLSWHREEPFTARACWVRWERHADSRGASAYRGSVEQSVEESGEDALSSYLCQPGDVAGRDLPAKPTRGGPASATEAAARAPKSSTNGGTRAGPLPPGAIASRPISGY